MSDPLLTRQQLRKLREDEGERQQQVKQNEGHWRSFKENPRQAPDQRVAENPPPEDYSPHDFSNADLDRAIEKEPESTRRARRVELERAQAQTRPTTQGFSDDELEDLQLSRADIERLKTKLAQEERAPVARNQPEFLPQENITAKKKNKFRPKKASRTVEGEKSRERNHTLNVAIVIVTALLAVLIYLIFNW